MEDMAGTIIAQSLTEGICIRCSSHCRGFRTAHFDCRFVLPLNLCLMVCFAANQYEYNYSPKSLGNWEVPKDAETGVVSADELF